MKGQKGDDEESKQGNLFLSIHFVRSRWVASVKGSIAPVRLRVSPIDEKSLNEAVVHTAKALKFWSPIVEHSCQYSSLLQPLARVHRGDCLGGRPD